MKLIEKKDKNKPIRFFHLLQQVRRKKLKIPKKDFNETST